MKNLIITGAALFISSVLLFIGNIINQSLVSIAFAQMGVSSVVDSNLITIGIYSLSAICLIGGIIATIIGIRANK